MTSTTLQTVTSADGTTIAYDKLGSGPAVVLICGGSVDRTSNAGLAQVLAGDFTVYNFDRRGRGDSGDTLPYAIEREIEDIEAVIDAAGGQAYLYGTSSGAALAFEAARALPGKVTKLALWEPPYIEDPAARPPSDTVETYEKLVAEGRRSDAVEYFTAKVVGLPPEFVAFAKTQPFWAAQEKIAHTLAYDGRIMGDYSIPRDKAAAVTQPTIVIAGGESFPFFLRTVAVLGDAIPNGESATIPGATHDVAPDAIGPVLTEFFNR